MLAWCHFTFCAAASFLIYLPPYQALADLLALLEFVSFSDGGSISQWIGARRRLRYHLQAAVPLSQSEKREQIIVYCDYWLLHEREEGKSGAITNWGNGKRERERGVLPLLLFLTVGAIIIDIMCSSLLLSYFHSQFWDSHQPIHCVCAKINQLFCSIAFLLLFLTFAQFPHNFAIC